MIFNNNPRKFTTDFFNEDFTPYQSLLDNIKITDDIRTTECPALEVPGFNKDAIEKLYQYVSTKIPHLYTSVKTAELFKHWYTIPRSEGYHLIDIKTEDDNDLLDNLNNKVHYPVNILQDPELLILIKNVFEDWWDSLRMVKLTRLTPGGWLNPHRDRRLETCHLNYFWMPLHNFQQQCMKMFPMGWLKQEVGSMYLFNHARIPHAVQHTEDFNRYVMVGRFKTDSIPKDLMEIYQARKNNYLDIFYN